MTENLTPATETFSHYGTTIRVTMTSPKIASQWDVELGGRIVYTPTRTPVRKPTPGWGLYCPATFTTEGLPYTVEFAIGSASSLVRDVAITDMRIGNLNGEGITRDVLRAIPIHRLLSAAINAAGITVMHYPANYDGPAYNLGDDGELVEIPERPKIGPDGKQMTDMDGKPLMSGMRVRMDNDPIPFPIRHGGARMPADFALGSAGVTQLSGEQQLRDVANLVKACETEGLPFTDLIAERYLISPRHARRLVSNARDAGLLDPLPKTDARSRKRTK